MVESSLFCCYQDLDDVPTTCIWSAVITLVADTDMNSSRSSSRLDCGNKQDAITDHYRCFPNYNLAKTRDNDDREEDGVVRLNMKQAYRST